jgi:hypothetical protein
MSSRTSLPRNWTPFAAELFARPTIGLTGTSGAAKLLHEPVASRHRS